MRHKYACSLKNIVVNRRYQQGACIDHKCHKQSPLDKHWLLLWLLLELHAYLEAPHSDAQPVAKGIETAHSQSLFSL